MKVTLYGIEFAHRRPTAHDYVFEDYAKFGAFAALCNARGIAPHVRSVFFDQNFMGFHIEMDPSLRHSVTHREVWACAASVFPQFELFDMVGHKDGKW